MHTISILIVKRQRPLDRRQAISLGAAVDQMRERLDELNVWKHDHARNWRNLQLDVRYDGIYLIANLEDAS